MLRTWALLFAIIAFASYGIRIKQSNEQMPRNSMIIYEHDYIRSSNLKGIVNNNYYNNPLRKPGTRIATELNRYIENGANYNPIIQRLNQFNGIKFDVDINKEHDGNTNNGLKVAIKEGTNDGTNSVSTPKKQYKTRRARRANAKGKDIMDINSGDIRNPFY